MSYQLTDALRLVWNWGNFLQEDTQPRLVNTKTGKSLAVLDGHSDYVRGAMMLGPDKVVTWSNDCSIRIWALDGTCEQVLSGHSAYIKSVRLLDKDRLASASGDDTIRLWSLRNGNSQEIGDLGRHASLHCVHNNRLVISSERWESGGLKHIDVSLIDSDTGRPVKTFPGDAWRAEIQRFDAATFLIISGETLQRVTWKDGKSKCAVRLPERQRQSAWLPLKNNRLVVAARSYAQPARLYFYLYDMERGTCLAARDIAGEEALWLAAGPGGDTFEAQLKDYRRITAHAATLNPIKTAGAAGYRADGFTCFAPEEQPAQTAQAAQPTLNVTWIDAPKATAAVFGERVSLHDCGALKDGRIVIALAEAYRIYDADIETYETLSPAAFAATYPDYVEAKHWDQCLIGNRYALAQHASNKRALDAETVLQTLQSTERTMEDHLSLTAGPDGLFLALSVKHGTLFQLSPAGDRLDKIAGNIADALIGGELVAKLDGTLMRPAAAGLAPLRGHDGSPIAMHGDAARRQRHYHLGSNGHLLVRQGSAVAVIEAETGETLHLLESGHGMGMWGFCALKDGPIVTWSRMSLRSWDAQSYAPLIELKDPEDWGPGYEYVGATPFGQAIFFSGQYTHDSRIMLWNGHNDLAVYCGHAPDEIASVTALKPGLFLSENDAQGGMSQTRLWRGPR